MKILIATDGSPQSRAAVAMLKNFRLTAQDLVDVVTVLDMAVPSVIDPLGDRLLNAGELESRARSNSQEILDESVEILASEFSENCPQIQTQILFGSPDTRILDAVRRSASDLVVIGSHGHSRLQRIILGSVSDSIVRHSPCSVLIVRSSGDGKVG